MKHVAAALLAALLVGCTNAPPPTLSSGSNPDDPAAPSATVPYRPVMAGTAYHGIGSKP